MEIKAVLTTEYMSSILILGKETLHQNECN